MFWDLIIAIWADVLETWDELNPSDFARPSFIGLWLIILFLPLSGTDRRDIAAGMVFCLFTVAAGVTLIFAMPKNFVPPTSVATEIMATLTMLTLAAVRWFYRAPDKRKVPAKSQRPSPATTKGA